MSVWHDHIYAIRHINTGLVKVGITADWFRRARELKLGRKTLPLTVAHVPYFADQAEKEIHKQLKAKRLPQSEWFELSEREVAWVLTRIEQWEKSTRKTSA